MRVGETVWNALKGSGTEKRGGETKILKKKGQAGLGDGCLKKGASGWNPLAKLWCLYLHCSRRIID